MKLYMEKLPEVIVCALQDIEENCGKACHQVVLEYAVNEVKKLDELKAEIQELTQSHNVGQPIPATTEYVRKKGSRKEVPKPPPTRTYMNHKREK